MNNPNPVATYALRLGDNGLVLAQRLGAWCGHAPELEIDLALANIGLDLLGQARNFLSYAAELNGCGDEDTLAFGRDERQYSNLLLVEQPNGNFADTIARQFFIDVWHVALFSRLVNSRDAQLAAIAAKGLKEVRYHQRLAAAGWSVSVTAPNYQIAKCSKRSTICGASPANCSSLMKWSSAWLSRALRLIRVNCRPNGKARYTRRFSTPAYRSRRSGLPLRRQTGLHSEHLGPLLAEMQYLQRSHPGLQW
ncbi:phenylacetate-CoA oxygenase, PaaI subunit [Klebsiella pneumoniae]|uniref:Phenylacetate-CoA oxygenase, PaaI subunit n=1 Tax=Klebsiella pneumoniae TaxID=573 RepID=A0A378F4G6_KLEPN|nr:phenylacetate-CoA oxygenase, PaaI subunit [Klebsiella pneumoniae]